MIIEQPSTADVSFVHVIASSLPRTRTLLSALRLVVHHLNRVGVAPVAKGRLSRHEAAQRVKEFLTRRYRDPNRCC